MTCIDSRLDDGEKYAEFLIKKGADINARARDGSTALLMACFWSQNKVAQFLANNGANLDASTHAIVN
jgi:ankyrin repeat protein